MKLSQQALVLIAVPLLFQFVLGYVMSTMLTRAEQAAEAAVHALRVKEAIDKCNRDQVSLLRQLIISKITDRQQIVRFDELCVLMPVHLKELRELVNRSPELSDLISQLDESEQQGLEILREAREIIGIDDNRLLPLMLRQLHGKFDKSIATTNFLTSKISQFQEKQHRSELQRQNEASLVVVLGLVLDVFMAAALVMYFNRSTTSRMDRLMENTMRLSRGDELLPRLRGEDELSQLDGVLHDVTIALREAHNKEREIIDNAVDLIFSLSSDGRFVAVNPAVETFLGYTQDELRGRRVSSLMLDDSEQLLEKLNSSRSGHSTIRFDSQLKRKNGSLVDVSWSVAAPVSQDVLFCVLHDISDRKAIERMKQEFIAMISHDLKTPLTSIMLFFENLAAQSHGDLPQSVRDRASGLSKTTSGLVQMVNDLMDIEKLEAGAFELNKEQILLVDLIDEVLLHVKEFASASEIKIDVKCHDGLKVTCDFEKIVRAVVNLVSNAIKFSPKQETVSIHASENENWVEIRVSDNGRGIAQDQVETIFEKWKQVGEQANTRMKGGSGLGLPICKSIVEKHGGSVSVDSEPGSGSRFTIKLPA